MNRKSDIQKQPLVSVAMPVFNAERYLRQSIESVLSQTHINFELVIVNDASQDASAEIILSYNDPRIRYHANAENQGILKTRNTCAINSSGKYIAILDNDDIAHPERLEKQVAFLEAHEDYGICGSFWQVVDSDNKILTHMQVPTSDLSIKTYLLFNNCFCNSSVMIRSQLLKENLYTSGYDMIEDYYFLHTMSKQTKLAILPEFLTQYRIHGKNTSIEKSAAMRRLRNKIDALILDDLGISYSPDEFQMHSCFVNGNFSQFGNAIQLRKLEDWLVKLYRHLVKMGTYDLSVVQQVISRRWVLLFRDTRKISYKIIFNRLFKRFGMPYLKNSFGMITEEFSNKINIY